MLGNLTLEEVSLSFRALAEQLPQGELPLPLNLLSPEEWGTLAHLLGNLMFVKEHSTVH
jgi:hypothetical protein